MLDFWLALTLSYTVSYFDPNTKVEQMSQIQVVEERLLTVQTVDQLITYVNGKYNAKYVSLLFLLTC